MTAGPYSYDEYIASHLLPPAPLPDLNDDCPICREPYGTDNENKVVQTEQCSHVFHYDCLLEWFNSHPVADQKNRTCPNCRRELFVREAFSADPLSADPLLLATDDRSVPLRDDLIRDQIYDTLLELSVPRSMDPRRFRNALPQLIDDVEEAYRYERLIVGRDALYCRVIAVLIAICAAGVRGRYNFTDAGPGAIMSINQVLELTGLARERYDTTSEAWSEDEVRFVTDFYRFDIVIARVFPELHARSAMPNATWSIRAVATNGDPQTIPGSGIQHVLGVRDALDTPAEARVSMRWTDPHTHGGTESKAIGDRCRRARHGCVCIYTDCSK